MDEHNIIATSPTIPADEYTLAHRIVIRDWGDQYVVHMQVFERNGAVSFNHGNYFKKRPVLVSKETPDWDALREAYEKFDERSRRIMGVRPMENK